MAKNDMPENVKQAVELLKQHGINAKVYPPGVKASFVVDKGLLKEFKRIAEALKNQHGWEVQDCINDAMEMWTEARKGLVKR